MPKPTTPILVDKPIVYNDNVEIPYPELLSEEAFLAKTNKEYKERLANMTYAELLGQMFLEALGVGGAEIYDSEHNLAYERYKEDYYKKKQGYDEQQFFDRLVPPMEE